MTTEDQITVNLPPHIIELLAYQLKGMIKRAEKRQRTPERTMIVGGLKSAKKILTDAILPTETD